MRPISPDSASDHSHADDVSGAILEAAQTKPRQLE
jgi:hypothetical protein